MEAVAAHSKELPGFHANEFIYEMEAYSKWLEKRPPFEKCVGTFKQLMSQESPGFCANVKLVCE